MSDTNGTYRPGVSIHEAAVMLGVSPTTVRRWVAAGRLRSQRFDRPQGEVVRVFVGPEQIDVPPSVREQVSGPQVSTDAPPHTTTARTEVPPAEQMATLAAAFLTPVLSPLVAELAATRQAGERKDDTIRELERENGTLRATVATLEAQRAPQTVETSPEPPPAFARFLTRWWPLLATLIVAMVLMVGLVGLVLMPR